MNVVAGDGEVLGKVAVDVEAGGMAGWTWNVDL